MDKEKAIEWINGELLGDGCLRSRHSCSACFSYASKYSEYIQYVSDKLESFGIERVGKIRKYYHKKYNCPNYCYCSRDYKKLISIFQQWYPEGKKIVPKDIELTPLTCRQWYIGDGSLSKETRWYGRSAIKLATCGFSIPDVNWLIKKLNILGFKLKRQPFNNSIRISVHSTKDFLDYIGKCPVKCYQYKWAY